MIPLQVEAKAFGILLTEEQLGLFETYMRLLLEWNERINLTAITDKEEILRKHFLDSLLLLAAWDFPLGASLIDIGSGAGFPGVPLKVCRADLSLTLLDSLQKRIGFLGTLLEALGFDCNAIHGRGELLSHESAYRECFDVATARAVAPLPLLCELCMGFVKVGGVFLAMKGPEIVSEISQSKRAIEILGGTLEKIWEYDLPSVGKRSIVVIKKISQTPTAYPRTFKKMSKTPF